MEIFGILAFILIIAIFVLMIFIPSLAMVFGMGWVSKKWFPDKHRWIRRLGVLAVLLIVPQVLNLVIERDVKKLVSQSHGELPHGIPVSVLAVETSNSGNSRKGKLVPPNCNTDCVLLLLSGTIDKYLVVQRTAENAHPQVTAFEFETYSDCVLADNFAGRQLSVTLANTVRELSLSDTCLTSRLATLGMADTLITYNKAPNPSWFTPPVKGHQLIVAQKNPQNGEWVETYKDIGIRYGQVYPILLPTFTMDKKRARVDVLRRIMYRTSDTKSVCKQSWFSDYGPCHSQLRYKSISKILGVSVSEQSLKKSGIIPDKTDRTIRLSQLVKTIISEGRKPSLDEWTLINHYISREYYDGREFGRLVIDVLSNDNFPVPQIYTGRNMLSEDHKALLLSATIHRIGQDKPGPEIGNSNESQQWKNLYNIINDFPAESLAPHFDFLVETVSKRRNEKRYVEFFEKFGPNSRQPILDLIEADKKRLSSLSSVMCELGTDLSGVEGPLLDLVKSGHINLNGNYGQIVYLLRDLGISEDEILKTVDPLDRKAANKTRSITRRIERYRSGKHSCR